MQRVYNVDKWSQLVAGSALELPGVMPRRVRLEVNSPSEVRLYYTDEHGELYFIALVKGRDTIEFHTIGLCRIHAEGGDCFVYTSDGDDIAFVNEDPVIFTKIMERRPRNPELEHIAAQMHYNMNRALGQQANELELLLTRRFEARERELALERDVRSAPSEPSPEGVGGAAGAPDSSAAGGGA